MKTTTIKWSLSVIVLTLMCVGCSNLEQVATVIIASKKVTFTQAQDITLSSATPETFIHYTLDGSDPTVHSIPYLAPFTVNLPTTIKAIAIKTSYINSNIASRNFTLETEPPPAMKPFILNEHSEYLDAYNTAYKIDSIDIIKIDTNGGNYPGNTKDLSIDNNINTFWETNRANSENFKNQITYTFNTDQNISRIVYTARQSAGNKGFLQKYEIYASPLEDGDDFTLVTQGASKTPSNNYANEIQFKKTTLKRIKIKFIEAKEWWTTVAEIAFYKEDTLIDKLDNIFTDKSYTIVNPRHEITTLIQLRKEAENHPLKDKFNSTIDTALKILESGTSDGIIFKPKQVGNIETHAANNLKFRFGTNLQSTGIYANPGDTLQIYVGVENKQYMPSIVFTQQLGYWSGWMNYRKLQLGQNTIIVPKIENNDIAEANKPTPGGAIYIDNPYLARDQGKITIKIIGGKEYPVFHKGDDIEAFMNKLEAFKTKVENDTTGKVINIAEIIGDRLLLNFQATATYNTYSTNSFTPQDTIEAWDKGVNSVLQFNGLDTTHGFNKNHDAKNLIETIRVMQPFAFMYAAGNHIGYQTGQQAGLLNPSDANNGSWGFYHEIGHNLEQWQLTLSEVTTNVNPMHMQTREGGPGENRVGWSEIYVQVAPIIQPNTFAELGGNNKIALFWQLELYQEGSWGEVQKYYRENNNSNISDFYDRYAQAYSQVLKLNLTEYFTRMGVTLSDETKTLLRKYRTTKDKIWYLRSEARYNKGSSYDRFVEPRIVTLKQTTPTQVDLELNISSQYTSSLLGYEILRDGEVIGFTAGEKFIDTNAIAGQSHHYSIIAYAKDLTHSSPIGKQVSN